MSLAYPAVRGSRCECGAVGGRYRQNDGKYVSYVGVAERAFDSFEFMERLEELNEELEVLNAQAQELAATIAEDMALLLSRTVS